LPSSGKTLAGLVCWRVFIVRNGIDVITSPEASFGFSPLGVTQPPP
jgi:hypothetical protein